MRRATFPPDMPKDMAELTQDGHVMVYSPGETLPGTTRYSCINCLGGVIKRGRHISGYAIRNECPNPV